MSALHVLHMCIGTSLSLVHLTALDYDLRIFFYCTIKYENCRIHAVPTHNNCSASILTTRKHHTCRNIGIF